MAAPGGQAGEIDKLKALLFSPESARLAAAEAHIDALESRVGDAPRLEAATAEILVDALRRAEVAQHRELAAAIAPVVVAAIRSEIHNSKDMMVEALYPITGRLVAAAVANAFRELIESINRRLDALVSTNQWKLRVKSLTSGRPMAEIALSQAMGANFQRILLFERGSGILLSNWSANAGRAENPELISGMIAAISEFAASVLSSQHGELRTLDLGASQVFLRASSQIVLAAETAGDLSRNDQHALDAAFLDLVDRHDRGETIGPADLAALGEHFGEPGSVDARAGKSMVGIAAAVLALLVGLALIIPILHWQREAAIARALERVRAANPALRAYPLHYEVDNSAGKVLLQGLAGSPADAAKAIAAVTAGATPYQVIPDIAIVASEAQLQASAAQASALKARIQDLESRTAAALTEIRGELKSGIAGKSSDVAAVGGAVEALSARLAETQATQSAGLETVRRDMSARIADKGNAVSALATDLQAIKLAADQQAQANTARIEALRGEFENRGKTDDARLMWTEQLVAATTARIDPLAAGLDAANKKIAASNDALAKLAMPAATTQDQFLTAITGIAIFFTTLDDFVSPEQANAHLDAIAAALTRTGEGIRVVGYADDTGGPTLNAENSRKRAAKVTRLLIERGVRPNKIVSVARAAQLPIADAGSPGHARNRRVTFEPLLSDEIAP